MDDRQALAILSALADGANPVTGEVFPGDSPYQTPDVIRALFVAVRVLGSQLDRVPTRSTQSNRPGDAQIAASNGTTASSRKASRPEQMNAGKPWSTDQDQQLLTAFDRDMPLAEIARLHGRTIGGVRARLEKHGRLEPSAATRWPNGDKGYSESSRQDSSS